jgi:hypothetical protein
LSEGTGGFLIANTNDFRKSFQQLIENLDAHYEAVYRPTSNKYDGRLRKIEVKLARNDLEVESRTGYFAMPDLKGAGPLTPVESTGLAVLSADPRPHAFRFPRHGLSFPKRRRELAGPLCLSNCLAPSWDLPPTPPARSTNSRFRCSRWSGMRTGRWSTSTVSTCLTTSRTPTWRPCAPPA